VCVCVGAFIYIIVHNVMIAGIFNKINILENVIILMKCQQTQCDHQTTLTLLCNSNFTTFC